MRSVEEIKKDIENIAKYHEDTTATRGYLRVIAEFLLDIREDSKKSNDKVLRAIEELKYT